MPKTEDVLRLLKTLREYEYSCRIMPNDILRLTEYTLRELLRQRDAAVEDLRMLGIMDGSNCKVCVHYNGGRGCDRCKTCPWIDNWEWRGWEA